MKNKIIPDTAVVCSQKEDSLYGRNFAGKLLEQQVSFAGRTEQKFMRKLPKNLDDFKAVFIEDEIFFKICEKKGAELKKLEKFAKEKYFHVMTYPLKEERNNRVLCYSIFETMLPSACAMAGIRCGDFSKSLPGPDFKTIFKETTDNLINFMKNSAGFYSEFHLHHFKPAKALIDAKIKEKELRKIFLKSAADFCESQERLVHHDRAGGLFSAVELYDMNGKTGYAEGMLKLVDDMIENRPRTPEGLVSGTGYNDDPLFLRGIASGNWVDAATNSRRNSVWTEILHFYGPCFGAAYRYSNDRKYLDEVMLLVKYIDTKLRDKDGLIYHVSVNSKIISSKWGRGIYHALFGVFYLLQELRNDEPEKKYIEEFIRKTFNALIKYQDKHSGLWRNIINKEYSRLETSSTVCFATVGAACINMNILDKKKFSPMVKNALEGLRKMYWRGGFAGNCTGTGTSPNDETYYLKRPTAWQVMPQLITALIEADKAGIIKL